MKETVSEPPLSFGMEKLTFALKVRSATTLNMILPFLSGFQ
jgi:hypothetical protein